MTNPKKRFGFLDRTHSLRGLQTNDRMLILGVSVAKDMRPCRAAARMARRFREVLRGNSRHPVRE